VGKLDHKIAVSRGSAAAAARSPSDLVADPGVSIRTSCGERKLALRVGSATLSTCPNRWNKRLS
jgi:hypothetical protein